MVNRIECPLKCPVPEGLSAAEVPRPRHDWGDVLLCPNGKAEGLQAPCGRTFLLKEDPE